MTYSATTEGKVSLLIDTSKSSQAVRGLNADYSTLVKGLSDTSVFDKLNNTVSVTTDSISNLGTTFVGTANTLGNTPFAIEGKLTDITTGFEKLEDVAGNRIAKIVFPQVTEQLGNFADKGTPVFNLLGQLSEESTAFDKTLVLISDSSKLLISGLNKLEKGLYSLEKGMKNVGIQSEFLSAGFKKIEGALGITENLVKVADVTYKTKEAFEDLQSVAGQTGQAISAIVTGASPLVTTLIDVNNPLQTLTNLSGIATLSTNKFVKALGTVGLQVQGIVKLQMAFGKIGDAIDILQKKWNELYKGFETMETLGVDTTMAKMATNLGLVGEKILFNIDATKQYIATATQAYTQLQEQTEYIRTLSAGAAYETDVLTDKLQNLATKGLKGAMKSGELAISVYNNLSAGIGTAAGKIDEAIEVSQTAAKYASATGGSLDSIQKALNFTQQAFGRTSAQSQDTMALLNNIVEQGVTNASELAEQIGSVSSVGASAGVNIKSLFSAVSIGTKTLGGDAYISIQRLLEGLSSLAPDSKKALDELGFTINAEVLKTKDLTTLMQELYAKAGGNVETLQRIIPQSIAFRGALSLMTTSTKDAKGVIDSFNTTSGEKIDEVFNRSQETITKRSQAIANGFQELFANAGKSIVNSGFFNTGLKAVEGILKYFQELPEPMKNILGGIVLFNTGLDKAIGVAQAFLGVITAIVTAFGTFVFFFRGGAFFSGITKGFQAASNETNLFLRGLKALQSGVQEAVGISVKMTEQGLKPVIDQNNEFVKGINKIGGIASKAFGIFKDETKDAEKNISGFNLALQNVKNAFKFDNDKSALSSFGEAFKNSFKGFSQLGSSLQIDKALDSSKKKAEDLTIFYSKDLNPEISKYIGTNIQLFKKLENNFTTLKNSLGNFKSIQMLKDSVTDTLDNISKGYEKFATNKSLQSLGQNIKNIFQTPLQDLPELFKKGFSNLQNIKFDSKSFTNLFSNISKKFEYNLNYALNYFKYFKNLLIKDFEFLGKTLTLPKIDISKLKDSLIIGLSNSLDFIQNKLKSLGINNKLFDNAIKSSQQFLNQLIAIDKQSFKNLKFPKLDFNFDIIKNKFNELKNIFTNFKLPEFNFSNLEKQFNNFKAPNLNLDNINKSINNIKDNFKNTFNNFNNIINNFKNIFKEQFNNLQINTTNLKTKFQNEFKQILDIGKDLGSKFQNLLSKSFDENKDNINLKSVQDKLKNGYQSIVNSSNDILNKINFPKLDYKNLENSLTNIKNIFQNIKLPNISLDSFIKSINKITLPKIQFQDNLSNINKSFDDVKNKFKELKLPNLNFNNIKNSLNSLSNNKFNLSIPNLNLDKNISVINSFKNILQNIKFPNLNIDNMFKELNILNKQINNIKLPNFNLQNNFDKTTELFNKLKNNIKDFKLPLLNLNINDIKDKINSIRDNFNNIQLPKLDLKDFYSSIDNIKNKFTNIFDKLQIKLPDINNLFNIFNEQLSNIKNKLSDSFKNIKFNAKIFLEDNVSKKFSEIKNTFVDKFKDLGTQLTNSTSKFDLNFIGNSLNKLDISSKLDKIFKPFAEIKNKINIDDLVSNIQNKFNNIKIDTNIFNKLINTLSELKDKTENVVNNIKDNFNKVKEQLSKNNIFESISTTFKNSVDKIDFNILNNKINGSSEVFNNIGKVISSNFLIAKGSVAAFGSSILQSFQATKLGATVIPLVTGAFTGLTGIMGIAGNVAKTMWSSVLAPLLPLVALFGIVKVIGDFIPLFGSVSEKAKNFGENVLHIGSNAKKANPELQELINKSKKDLGESNAQLDSFSAKIVDFASNIPKLINWFLEKITFGLSKFLGISDALNNFSKFIKGFAVDIEKAFDSEAIIQINKELDETDQYLNKIKNTTKKLKEGSLLPVDILKEEIGKSRLYLNEFEKETQNYINTLGNSEADEALKAQAEKTLEIKRQEFAELTKLSRDTQKIYDEAKKEQRTLTTEELNKVDESETKAFELRKESIQNEVKALEARYEEAKKVDSQEAEGYKNRIDRLNSELAEQDQVQKALKERRKTLNEFTDNINRKVLDIGTNVRTIDKNFDQVSEELTKSIGKASGVRKEALTTINESTKQFKQNIDDIVTYGGQVADSQGKLTTFQQQTLNSFANNTKEVGLSIKNLMDDSFNPTEFRNKIQYWIDGANQAMEDFDDPEIVSKVFDQLEKTEVSYVDGMGNIVKTTLDKTLSPEQLRKIVETKLQIVDKIVSNKNRDIQKNIDDLQNSIDLGNSSDNNAEILQQLQEQQKLIRENTEKGEKDKLDLIEKEFGKESTQYKEQYRKLLEQQRQFKKDNLKDQQDLLDARLQQQIIGLNKEKSLLEKNTVKGSNDKDIDELQKNEEKQLEVKTNKLKEEIELYREGSSKRLELEIDLQNSLNDLDKKRLDNKKDKLNRELDLQQNKVDKEKNLLERNTIKGTTDSDVKKLQELNESELNNKITNLSKQKELYKVGSKERINIEKDLQNSITELQKSQFDFQQKLVERKFNNQQNALDKEKELASKQLLDGSTNEELKKIDDLNTKELQLKVQQLQEKSKLVKSGSDEEKAIQKDLMEAKNSLEEQQIKVAKDQRKRYLDDLVAMNEQNSIDNEKALQNGNISREEFDKKQLENSKNISIEKQKYLNEELKHLQVGSKEYISTLKELSNEQLNTQKLVIEQQVKDLNNALDTNKNTIQSNINDLQKLTTTYDNYLKELDIEKSIRDNNNNILKETNDLEINSLEFKKKNTTDLVKQAEIDLQIKEKQVNQSNLEIQNQIDNLEIQKQNNKLNEEKELINIRINKLESERNILVKENEISIAKLNNESELSIQTKELELDSLKEQNNQLNISENLIKKKQNADDKNLEQQKNILLKRQELTKDNGSYDLEIAKQNVVIAGYEKQLKQIQLSTKEQELNNQVSNRLQEKLTKEYERQNTLLESRKSVIESLKSNTEATLNIAIQGAKSEKDKERLQQNYNSIRLQILNKQQEIDLFLFDLQQKQNKLALERQTIENNIAITKQKAAILEAQIEEKKVLARKDATEEEKELALLNTKAAQDTLTGLQQQSEFLNQQKKDTEIISKLQRDSKLREQNTQRLTERQNIASSTKSTFDDQLVSRDATNQFYSNLNSLSKELNEFKLDQNKQEISNSENIFNKLSNELDKKNNPNIVINNIEPIQKHDDKSKIIYFERPTKIKDNVNLKENIKTKTNNTEKEDNKKNVVINIDARVNYTGNVSEIDKNTFKDFYNDQTNTLVTELERRL